MNAFRIDKLIQFARLHLGDGNEEVGGKQIHKSWVEAFKVHPKYGEWIQDRSRGDTRGFV